MPNEHIFTVTEFNRNVRLILEETFDEAWIEGEVSNFVVPRSGHWYFNLKDETGSLKCVMFKSSSVRVKFDVEDGMNVLCKGRVSVYEKQGQYQLYVDKIEPRGKGALYLAFEKLKKKLSSEGLFDEEAKKPIPEFPARMGVVTSATGAAIRDILKVTRRRFSNMEVTICPVRVQGDGASSEIAEAIRVFNEYNEYIEDHAPEEFPVEVLIVGRGGGSIEDLWAFNEEEVARAIYESRIPVVSAVGHEIDWTISDFVSDQRAATPSAAAEIVIPERDEILSRINGYKERLDMAVSSVVRTKQTALETLRDSYVMREPMNVLLQLEQEIDDLLRRGSVSITHYLAIKKNELHVAGSKLDMLNPLAILDRGYSITYCDDKPLKDATKLKKGDKIISRLAKGEVGSVVE